MATVTRETAPQTPAEVKEACEKFRATFANLKAEIGKVVVGHSEVVEGVLMSLFAGGNVLLEVCRGWARRCWCERSRRR